MIVSERRKGQLKANSHAWYVAHKDVALARGKAWRAANKDRCNALSRSWDDAHPDGARGRNERSYRRLGPEYKRAWRAANAGINRDIVNRRRARKAGVIVVRLSLATCGVCAELLVTVPYPDPMTTTVGHEPPLARCQPGDTVMERPEHLRCNQRKGTRLDGELRW